METESRLKVCELSFDPEDLSQRGLPMYTHINSLGVRSDEQFSGLVIVSFGDLSLEPYFRVLERFDKWNLRHNPLHRLSNCRSEIIVNHRRKFFYHSSIDNKLSTPGTIRGVERIYADYDDHNMVYNSTFIVTPINQ